MMNRKVMVMGCLVLCLIAVMFMAGCTSQNKGNAPSQTTAQQPAVTTPQATPAAMVSSAAADQGLVSDEAGDIAAQADAFNATQGMNSIPDSTDFGDIMP